jgi:purine nucleosidase
LRPIILDMDPGVDDALALLLALGCADAEVVAVTTVHGNVSVEKGAGNALRILALADAPQIPVYRGEGAPLEGPAIHAEHVHGQGGLGAARLPAPDAAVAGDAVAFLIEELSRQPGSLTLVATGPLTNLAAAERRRPGVLTQAGGIVIMGGSIHEPGNASPRGEFNVVADAVAAREVLNSGATVLLVPLDATRQVLLTVEAMERMAREAPEPIRRFVCQATRTPMERARTEHGYEGLYLHDPLAVGLAVRPELGRRQRSHLDVECGGELTRGQIVADERNYVDTSRRQGVPIEWVDEVDCPGFMRLFEACVFGAHSRLATRAS